MNNNLKNLNIYIFCIYIYMNNYYSKKYGGIGYAINYINSKKKNILDEEESNIRKRNLLNNQNIQARTSREATISKIIAPVAGVSAPIAGSKLKKIFNIYKNNKNIQQSKNNENENDDVEGEGEGEPNLDIENGSEVPGEVSEIEPRPMTDAEISEFADPFTRESQNTTSRLNFDDVNEPEIGESEVGEMEPTETPQLTGFSKMIFGETKTSDFTPEGSTSAGYAPEGETGGYDVGVELDPDTMTPLENVGEVADEAPEVTSDFQSILDMANAPKSAQVVSFGDAEPASATDPDIVYGGNTQYDNITSFGRSGADMTGTQFGGDSTIARLNNFEDMNPAEQYESHADDISTFGDAGDVANLDDVTTGAGETGEAVSSTVGETVGETAEVAPTAIDDVVEGLGVAEAGVDAVAIGADSTALATAPVPVVDIVTATVGAVATVAAIGTSVGLGIASAIQSGQQTTTAQQDAQISNIPAPQTNIAGRYLGGKTNNLYPSSEQNY